MARHLVGDSHHTCPERCTRTGSPREAPYSPLVEGQPGQRICGPCNIGDAAPVVQLNLHRSWKCLLIGWRWKERTEAASTRSSTPVPATFLDSVPIT